MRHGDPRRVAPRAAWLDGLRRVASAPFVLIGAWLMTVVVSVPLTVVIHTAIASHLGASLQAEAVAAGADLDWMQEFGDQASGVETTFGPNVIGFAAVLSNLSALADVTTGTRPAAAVLAAGAVYLLLWIFLSGGVVDRLARDRPTRAHGFFAACGGFFVRFLRLGILSWVVYALLLGYAHRLLFADWYPSLTRDLTQERSAFLVRLALYALFALLLAACNIVFDYAKVRAVVEDRRSMTVALAASIRFIARNPGAVVALYFLNVALFVVVLAVYALVAPGAGSTGASMWIGFAIGQLYVAGRLAVKLAFWASETALFQSRLAHAGYVARAQPAWPESASVEAVARM